MRQSSNEMFILERALRLLGYSLTSSDKVPSEKLIQLLELIDPNDGTPFDSQDEASETLNYYVKDHSLLEINPDDDEFTVNFFLNLSLELVSDGLWKFDLSFLESYSYRPKFSKYEGTIWLEQNGDKTIHIACIEYNNIKLIAEDKGKQWNILKFILRSSAVCYIILKNYVSNGFLDKLLFMTFSFTKDNWKLLLEDILQINNFKLNPKLRLKQGIKNCI